MVKEMSEYRIVKPDELYHYGVKGMKWGVRKKYTKELNRLDKQNAKEYTKSLQKYREAAINNQKIDYYTRIKNNSSKDSNTYRKASSNIDYISNQNKQIVSEFNAHQSNIRNNKKRVDKILKDLGNENVRVVKDYKMRYTLAYNSKTGNFDLGTYDGTRYKVKKRK